MRKSLSRAATVLVMAASALVGTNVPANAEPGCGGGHYESGGVYYLTYYNCAQSSAVWRHGYILATGNSGAVSSCKAIGPHQSVVLVSYYPSWAVTSTDYNPC
jgi:hypothetical protein